MAPSSGIDWASVACPGGPIRDPRPDVWPWLSTGSLVAGRGNNLAFFAPGLRPVTPSKNSDFRVFDVPSMPGVQPDLRPFRERRWPLSAADLAERRLRRAERRLRRALPPGPQGPKARRKEAAPTNHIPCLLRALPTCCPAAVCCLFLVPQKEVISAERRLQRAQQRRRRVRLLSCPDEATSKTRRSQNLRRSSS